MKNKLLTTLIIITIPFFSSGQYHSEVTSSPALLPATPQIYLVRSYKMDTTILYAQTNTSKYLAQVDHLSFSSASPLGFPMKVMPLPPLIGDILDMKIAGNYLYFCGKTSGGVGMIGYANLNDFSSGPVNLQFILIRQATRLKKLAVRASASNINIVAIGSTFPPSGASIVVEVNDVHNPSIGHYGYAISPNEQLHAVFATGGNIVMAGFNTGLNALILRKTNQTNALSPILDIAYYYPSAYHEGQYGMVAAPNDDKIAIAYMHYENTPNLHSARLRHFDLATMQNYNTHEIPLYNKPHIHDLANLTTFNRSILLMDYPDSVGIYRTCFLPIDPTASTQTSYTLHYPNNIFYSLDTVHHRRFTSGGTGHLYLQDLGVGYETFAGCITIKPQHVQSIPPLPMYSLTIPLSYQTERFIRDSASAMALLVNAPYECAN